MKRKFISIIDLQNQTQENNLIGGLNGRNKNTDLIRKLSKYSCLYHSQQQEKESIIVIVYFINNLEREEQVNILYLLDLFNAANNNVKKKHEYL